MKKSMSSIIIALALCLSLLPSVTPAAGAADAGMIEISTAAELKAFAQRVNNGETNLNAILTADVYCSGAWTTIGGNFSGIFDGNGHTVSWMNQSSGGLFGTVDTGAEVRNLCVNGNIYVNTNSAGAIARENKGLIENCGNIGVLGGYWSNVGGIAGNNESTGTIRNCYNAGYIDNNGGTTGGITADNRGGTIENCYNTGTVIGASVCGGIAGQNNNNAGTIKNCYNMGPVTGASGTTNDIAGLNSANSVENCYYSEDGGETFRSYDGQQTSISAAQLADLLNDGGGWEYDPGLGHPVLRENQERLYEEEIDTYYIYDLADLEWFRDYINNKDTNGDQRFYLMADIDMSSVYHAAGSTSWTPIGNAQAHPFKGAFDGGGHKITGLYIGSGNSSGSDQYEGLFGYVDGGVVKNLGVSGSVEMSGFFMMNDLYAGGVVGHNSGTVTNCYNTVNVSIDMSDSFHMMAFCAGGVVGRNSGTVLNCYNTGDISGELLDSTAMMEGNVNIGGVVGYNLGTVTNCHSVGGVSGKLAGPSDAVEGAVNLGGVVGYNTVLSSGGGTVINCYYQDNGTADRGIGRNDNSGTVLDETELVKTSDQFASGEVAWLLRGGTDGGIWGQQLTGGQERADLYPILNAEKNVYAITLIYVDGDAETLKTYGNSDFRPASPKNGQGNQIFTWYTDPNCTQKWNGSITEDCTLYGKWIENPIEDSPITPTPPTAPSGGDSSPTTYPPTVSKAEHGSTSVSPKNPRRGDAVTVVPVPDDGYEVGSVAVKDRGGNVLEVRDNGDGTYSFIQPSGTVTVEVTFVPRVVETEPSAPAFSDLDPNAWYREAVDYVIDHGLMSGYGDGTFGPNDTLSRAMLAQILYNQAGGTAAGGGSPFADVLPGAWYADAVTWASANGIVSGLGDSRYGPDDPITREQLAAMLYRFARSQNGSAGDGMSHLDYSETEEVSEYAREAVAWCVMNGILGGYGDGTLRPQGQATRAEAATMLMQFLSL